MRAAPVPEENPFRLSADPVARIQAPSKFFEVLVPWTTAFLYPRPLNPDAGRSFRHLRPGIAFRNHRERRPAGLQRCPGVPD